MTTDIDEALAAHPAIPDTARSTATVRRILAIDPGTHESAWLLLGDGDTVVSYGMAGNETLLDHLRHRDLSADLVVIETIEPRYGQHTGWETLDTARLLGRMEEAARPLPTLLFVRSRWLRALGIVTARKKGEPKGNADAGVRAYCIDRWGGPGAERKGGPLAGITKDVWQALGIAVCAFEKPTEGTR